MLKLDEVFGRKFTSKTLDCIDDYTKQDVPYDIASFFVKIPFDQKQQDDRGAIHFNMDTHINGYSLKKIEQAVKNGIFDSGYSSIRQWNIRYLNSTTDCTTLEVRVD